MSSSHSPRPSSHSPRPSSMLARFLAAAVSQVGAPYIWGAKGGLVPGEPVGGGNVSARRAFDCSGLVTWAYYMAGGQDWRATHNSDVLFEVLPEVLLEDLQPGDLLFWGDVSRVNPEHVGIHLGAGALVSAAGGDSDTRTLEDARAAKACVRAEASIHYRTGFLGARRLSFGE